MVELDDKKDYIAKEQLEVDKQHQELEQQKLMLQKQIEQQKVSPKGDPKAMQRSLDKVPEIRESLEMSQHGTGRDGQMRTSQQKLPGLRSSNENPILEDPEISSPIQIEKARNTAGQGGTNEDEYGEIDDEVDGKEDGEEEYEYDDEDYEYYEYDDENDASKSKDLSISQSKGVNLSHSRGKRKSQDAKK